MNKEKRRRIFEILAAERPDPKSELNYTTPFELLIAVMLSAQATDKSVNIATAKLFPAANTAHAITALGVEGLEPYIRTIGLWRAKAKHIIDTCTILEKDFNGEVPADFDALTKLPGVGTKTANVVLNVAFGKPTIAVDTHIFPRRKPYRYCSGKNAAGRDGKTAENHAQRVSHQCAPLAFAARPLLLQGKKTRVRRLSDF